MAEKKQYKPAKGDLVTTKTGLTAKVFSVHSDGYVMRETYGVFRQEDVKPAKKPYRLAKGADGKERPWTPEELFQLYMRGWRDGAGGHAMRKDHDDILEYEHGYSDGRIAWGVAAARACKKLKYEPSVLRLAKGKNGTRQRQR
jgi:hypothetical protein